MGKIVPVVPSDLGEGNTKPPPKKQISPAKNWCFTLFNIEKSDLEIFCADARLENSSKILIGGLEVCPETGKPHRHGVLSLQVKKRPVGLFTDKTVHWEKQKGTTNEALRYCVKDGEPSYVCDFVLPRDPKPVKVLEDSQLNAWELKINEIIACEPDDREIFWFYSKLGDMGKTTFCKYLYKKHEGNIVVIGGKSADSKNCVASFMAQNDNRAPSIVLLPIPKSLDSDFLSYEGMESIKDMFFYSGKYEGAMVCDNPPHLFVFSNKPPDRDKCSADRWEVYEILDKLGNYEPRDE